MVNQNKNKSKKNNIFSISYWSIILVWIPIMQDLFNNFDFYQKFRNMEPITSKLSRWIFGFKLPHPARAEFIFESDIPDHIFHQVKSFYCQTDKQLFFGVSRKYLYLLFKQLDLIKNDKEKLEFYQRSGYYQKKNQRVSSVHFKYFVQMVEDFYNRSKKANSELTYDDFIIQLKDAHNSIIKKYQNWEIKAQIRRSEYLKMSQAIQEVRSGQIKIILKEDPFMSEETLENKLSQYGLSGLSLKEKLLFYQLRLQLFSILLDSYRLKQNDQFLLDSQKRKKLDNNVLKYETLVNQEQQKCDKIEQIIKQLFKGEWHSI